jgi:hypothetical protein
VPGRESLEHRDSGLLRPWDLIAGWGSFTEESNLISYGTLYDE